MIIVSKVKDYYDYLSGVYGIDEKLVFDRRYENYLLPTEPIPFSGKRIIEPTKYTFAICGELFEVFFFNGKCYHTLPELFELGKEIAKYENVPEVFPAVSGWKSGINFDTPPRYKWSSVHPLTFKEWSTANYGKTKVNQINRWPILVYPEKSVYWHKEVYLKDFGFASWYPPDEIYQNITAFLGWLVDNPPEPDNQTNKGKIESHGFDLKRSFRPKMK